MPVGGQDKRWIPHVICDYCCSTFTNWLKGETRAMHFVIPRIWRKPSDHHTECYFCIVDSIKRRKGKNAPLIEYSNIPSSIAPVPHNTTDLPVPQPPSRDQSCPAEASLEDSKKKASSLSAFVMRRRHRLGNKIFLYYSDQEDIIDLI